MIGKLSSTLDRGFVFDLVPTPLNDAGEPACSLLEPSKDDKKKPSKSKSQTLDSSSLAIDKDWVAEHARQVAYLVHCIYIYIYMVANVRFHSLIYFLGIGVTEFWSNCVISLGFQNVVRWDEGDWDLCLGQ